MYTKLISVLSVWMILAMSGGTPSRVAETADTFYDSRTGLVWVRDSRYAVHAGFSGDALMPRVRALELVRRMNSGEIENFGFADWRLPTYRELEGLIRRPDSEPVPMELESTRRLFSMFGGASDGKSLLNTDSRARNVELIHAWPVRGQAVLPGFSNVVILGANSVRLKQNSSVLSGDVVANDVSLGPTLGCSGRELCIGLSAIIAGGFAVKGDSIQIKSNADVFSDLFCNDLLNNGANPALTCAGLDQPGDLPIFPLLPAFKPVIGTGSDVTVAGGESIALPPGEYGLLKVKQNGSVLFFDDGSGCLYSFREIDAGLSTELRFADPCDVRVEEKFALDQNSFLGADVPGAVSASEIILYIAGINGNSGNLGATPRAAKVGISSDVSANFYVPNGTLWLRQNSIATGAFIALDTILGIGAQVSLDSFFADNQPPLAVGDSASLDEGAFVTIDVLANDSDPEMGPLTLNPTPLIEPLHGSLSPAGSGFQYQHDGGETSSDSFQYEVCDQGGLCAAAFVDITINPVNDPPTVTLTADPASGTAPLTVVLTAAAADAENGPLTFGWDFGDGTTLQGGQASETHVYAADGDFTAAVTVSDQELMAQDSVVISVQLALPPDPSLVATPVNRTVATTIGAATEFLYTGLDPIQKGVAPGTIEPQRAAVIRGKVLDRQGNPLAGVAIRVLGHPEFGETLSRIDGMFDMAVNGGGALTAVYEKDGFLVSQRELEVPWQDYSILPNVALVPLDPVVTAIDLNSGSAQVARGSVVSDSDGTRQATLLFRAGTQAEMVLPDGTSQPISQLSVRATEFTLGDLGPQAMPAQLPAASAYTYAVEFSADEAMAGGAKEIAFTQPVIAYIEDFLGFQAGVDVPLGNYDSERGTWVPFDNGLVIGIVGVNGSLAEIDADGSGLAADAALLASLGIDEEERVQLASLYSPGQTLWRVAIPHFSTWDCNWGFFPPPDAAEPDLDDLLNPRPDDPCEAAGSVIDCQNQVLGERIPLAGSDLSLHYSSERTSGFRADYTVEIATSGTTLPASLKRIDIALQVAGRSFQFSQLPLPNQTLSFTWDGLDAYGRLLQGKQRLLVRLGYVYDGLYQGVNRFGYNGNGESITAGSTRGELAFFKEQTTAIGSWDQKALGLGGWSLSAHHSFDPLGKILYLGRGNRRSASNLRPIVESVISSSSEDVAIAADGTVYYARNRFGICEIRRRTVDGSDIRIAGTGSCQSPVVENVAATSSGVHPAYIALDGKGNLYLTESTFHIVRRIDTSGIINTIAGTGVPGFSGDGGPAADAQINTPEGLAVASDGTLYFASFNNHRIRRIDPSRIIDTVAGTGAFGSDGDGGLAVNATLRGPIDVELGPDGSLFIADFQAKVVRRVTPDGIIARFAGTGAFGPFLDGIPATEARLPFPRGLAMAPDGTLFISGSEAGLVQVRKVAINGILNVVAGGESGSSGDGGPAADAQFQSLQGLDFGPDDSLYLASNSENRLRRVGSPIEGFSITEFAVPSSDGEQVYEFDAFGRHLRTRDALTDAVLFQFRYDSEGRLIEAEGGDGQIVVIERDASGNPTGLRAPFGQLTALNLNPDGFLSSVSNPLNETFQMAYSPDGLLTAFTNPRNYSSQFAYGPEGRLMTDQNAAGGSSTLNRAELDEGFEVFKSSALGRQTAQRLENLPTGEERRTSTSADGLENEIVIGTNGSRIETHKNGTTIETSFAPDPRFGMLSPLVKNRTIRSPAGLTSVFSESLTTSSNGDVNGSFTINGRTFATFFDSDLLRLTSTSAAGRQFAEAIDDQGRTLREEVPGLAPVRFEYDAFGRLARFIRGEGTQERVTSFTYNANGDLETFTDPMNQTLTLQYDAAGRITNILLPDGSTTQIGYDANANVTSFTPSGRPSHLFGYTAADLLESYTRPGPGTGSTTSFTYNADGQVVLIDGPQGDQISRSYDSAGRLSSFSIPRGTFQFFYDTHTGNTSSIIAPGAEALSFSHDGRLLVQESWSGSVVGTVGSSYDQDFRLASQSVNGTAAVSFQYDADDLLQAAGDLSLNHDPQNGLLASTSLHALTDVWTYSMFGETEGYSAAFNGTPVYSVQYVRNQNGRIIGLSETVDGVANNISYGYDSYGRLVEVVRNGSVSAFSYDSNGNRLSLTTASGVLTGSYDDQDRLTQFGDTTYTYTEHGDLLTRVSAGEVTSYDYDLLGNLLSVSLSDGTQIGYVLDGRNRRVGRKVNGTLMQGFLYADQLNPVAELDGSGQLVSRFIYASKKNVPDFMIRDGSVFRIISDHLGSPRIVIDSQTGQIVQRLDYDAFGNVLFDSNPGFQPFGFGGGLYDTATGLVRFGSRDYDADAGRWTSKDPLLFGGGDSNLYVYVLNDPVNNLDPEGKPIFIIVGGAILIGGAVTLTAAEAALILTGATLLTVAIIHDYGDDILDAINSAIDLVAGGEPDAVPIDNYCPVSFTVRSDEEILDLGSDPERRRELNKQERKRFRQLDRKGRKSKRFRNRKEHDTKRR